MKTFRREDCTPQVIKAADKIRKSMIATVEQEVPGKEVGVFLSAGVDSNACLAAAMWAGKKPVVYTVTANGLLTLDYVLAQRTAKKFGLKCVPIDIKLDEPFIRKYLKTICWDVLPGAFKSKATIETHWAFFELLRRCEQPQALLGFHGDTYFCTLRSLVKKLAALGVDGYWAFMRDYFTKYVWTEEPSEAQYQIQCAFMEHEGINLQLVRPLCKPAVFNALSGMHPIKEGCKPIQKAPLRLAFHSFFQENASNIRVNSPLQKGDLKADEIFKHVLLNSDLNIRGAKDAKAIYNDILHRRVKPI